MHSIIQLPDKLEFDSPKTKISREHDGSREIRLLRNTDNSLLFQFRDQFDRREDNAGQRDHRADDAQDFLYFFYHEKRLQSKLFQYYSR